MSLSNSHWSIIMCHLILEQELTRNQWIRTAEFAVSSIAEGCSLLCSLIGQLLLSSMSGMVCSCHLPEAKCDGNIRKLQSPPWDTEGTALWLMWEQCIQWEWAAGFSWAMFSQVLPAPEHGSLENNQNSCACGGGLTNSWVWCPESNEHLHPCNGQRRGYPLLPKVPLAQLQRGHQKPSSAGKALTHLRCLFSRSISLWAVALLQPSNMFPRICIQLLCNSKTSQAWSLLAHPCCRRKAMGCNSSSGKTDTESCWTIGRRCN